MSKLGNRTRFLSSESPEKSVLYLCAFFHFWLDSFALLTKSFLERKNTDTCNIHIVCIYNYISHLYSNFNFAFDCFNIINCKSKGFALSVN